MKVKGIERGQTIELLEAINILDGTEVSVEIDDRKLLTPEKFQKRVEEYFNSPNDQEAIEDLATTLATMEAEEREMLELLHGNRDDQVGDESRPLVSFIGAAKGSFATPEEVDPLHRRLAEMDFLWESYEQIAPELRQRLCPSPLEH